MKILLAPDSFKGSLSAAEAAEAMAEGIWRATPDTDCVLLPLADGGEGTTAALVTATGGRLVPVTVTGPLGAPAEAAFGLLGADGQTAVVEMAAAAGLLLVPPGQRDPRQATTYGVGELLEFAASSGARRLIVGLGGSVTTDGGAGALQALGVEFFDTEGRLMPAPITGGDLVRLGRVDTTGLRFPNSVSVVLASDVTNPLLGPMGAARVFGPQKGATEAIVAELEAGLTRLAALLPPGTAERPGAGAAGGLGAGLLGWLGAEMQSGIDLVLDTIGFDAHLHGADWVWTGEGRIDAQTLQGKAISGVLRRARVRGVPVLAFGGAVETGAAEALTAAGLSAAFTLLPGPMPLEEALRGGAAFLADAAERVIPALPAAKI